MVHARFASAILAGAIATGTLGSFGAAHAGSGLEGSKGPTATFADARITVAQAIASAETHLGGNAIGAGSEEVDGATIFYVEVPRYGRKHKVIVDLRSGRIDDARMTGHGDT